ncbi:MAG TPA: MMPL family transporter [Acidimicrobiales bacterium]|nr:MMPL family transporter [Acidimicrobiales bacterium]
MLESVARWVVKHRVAVLSFWAALLVLGIVSAASLPGLLSTSLAVPGTGAQKANMILARQFGENIEGTFTVVFLGPKVPNKSLAVLERRFDKAARAVPTGLASPLQRADGVVYGNVGSSLGLRQAANYTGDLRVALKRDGLPPALVTGAPALQSDVVPLLASDLRVGEVVTAVLALALLTLSLGPSKVVLLPFIVAVCTTSATLAVVYVLAHVVLMVLYVPNLVELIGLGLAVDYSLLITHRYREELGRQGNIGDALATTMATAGRAVLVSGIAVAVGLAVLLVVPVPFVQSLGAAGLLVPVTSIAAALTLQPALLSIMGRGNPPRLQPARASAAGHWASLGARVTRRPLAWLAPSSVALLAAAAPVAWLQLTPASVTAIPHVMQSAQGLDVLRDRIGPGIVTPIEIVLDSGSPRGALRPAAEAATLRLAHELGTQSDVFVVAIGTRAPYISSSGRYGRTIVVERDDFGDEASQQLVQQLQDKLVPDAHFPSGDKVWVGGAPAQGYDFLTSAYGRIPWVVAAVAAISYVVLLRAFRSVLLPLMALLLDGLSVCVAYGLVVLTFRFGLGADVLGLYRVTQIEGWVPMFLFAMLLGLSMDYEVFIVSRMREEWDRSGSTEKAIVEGLARTGRVVSVAGLVMVGALSGLVAGRIVGLQELGVGLALGVLIDSTLVRGVLMPSLMALLGPWNWWLPAPVAWLARVKASPRHQGRK